MTRETFVWGLLALWVSYAISLVVWNIWFHPLRNFPGPLAFRATRLPHSYALLSGRLPFELLKLHQKYGRIVRVAPDELSLAGPTEWQESYGSRKPMFDKDPKFWQPIKREPEVLGGLAKEHGPLRRTIAPGFSDKNLREQEALISKYFDLFILRLQENCQQGKRKLDMTQWYNWITFDVIGDLASGEPFGCLEKTRTHPYVHRLLKLIDVAVYLIALGYYPIAQALLVRWIPNKVMKKLETLLYSIGKDVLRRRMAVAEERPDLVQAMLDKNGEVNFTMPILEANVTSLIIAGSETTSTVLSGITWYLLKNPDKMEELIKEVRSTFKTEEEINVVSVNTLSYMLACVNEGLRIYPPVATSLPRIVLKGGAVVSGHFIPEKTSVSINHYVVYHWDKLFKDPFEYHPERFLGDPRYADDAKDAFQPFSIGPRNCLGKNLAYLELRMILTRLLWNFDLKLAEDSQDWIRGQKVSQIWRKPPLNVYLTPVKRL